MWFSALFTVACLLTLLTCVFTLPLPGKTPEKSLLNLDKKEQAFLLNHPVIRGHNDNTWPPFNFNVEGTPKGLSIDYMNLLADKIGIKVEYVTGEWGDLINQALAHAVHTKKSNNQVLFNSDRGVQYASDAFQKDLKDNNLLCSMSRKGNCWDNAVVESFFPFFEARMVAS